MFNCFRKYNTSRATKKHPVALFFFNRLETTKKVAERIIDSKPSKVYLVADGPRANVVGEYQKCQNVRNYLDSLNWGCSVEKIFSENNLGCGRRLSSGISEILAREEALIILEDDILPHQDFFEFCYEMLDYYQNDESVFHVSGLQFKEKIAKNDSYQFDFNVGVWGWATWRRAWQFYSLDVTSDLEDQMLWESLAPHRCDMDLGRSNEWRNYLKASLIDNKVDTWDYQWSICIARNRGFCVSPNWNLVKNIGFGDGATHTKGPAASHFAGLFKSYPINWPIQHPKSGLLTSALKNLNSNNLDNAESLSRVGINKYPLEERFWICIANCYAAQNDFQKSEEAILNALRIHPSSNESLNLYKMIKYELS